MRGGLGEVAPENSGRRMGSEREGKGTSRIPLRASDVQPQWDLIERMGVGGGRSKAPMSCSSNGELGCWFSSCALDGLGLFPGG